MTGTLVQTTPKSTTSSNLTRRHLPNPLRHFAAFMINPFDWLWSDQMVMRDSWRDNSRFTWESQTDALVVSGELAGYRPEDVAVEIKDGTLTIRANVEETAENKYSKASIYQQLRIGDNIDVEKVTAAMENGLLIVRLPFVPEQEPKRIPISPETSR